MSFKNALTRFLNQVIPIKAQQSIRDSGRVQTILDSAFSSAFFLLCVIQPNILLSHWRLSSKIEKIIYGENPLNFVECIKLKDTGPVVIFVHGGAWGSGLTWQYRKICESIGISVQASEIAIVGYPVYPAADMFQQVESVMSAVMKIKSQMRSMTGSKQVILVGHSSGAHIGALSVIKGGTGFVDAFVGLCGVYDLNKYHEFELFRGINEVSCMSAAAVSPKNFSLLSPTLLIKRGINAMGFESRPTFPPSLLIHGESDTSVPRESTERFADALAESGVKVSTNYPRNRDHFYPIVSLLCLDKSDEKNPIRQLLQTFVNDLERRDIADYSHLDIYPAVQHK